jgi:ubiquinone/menaquinone biosynthesis C-methylase UbiE
LQQLANLLDECPNGVVDLGCGTGLSTVAWADLAGFVVGVDANATMLAVAKRAPHVTYMQAFAHDVALASGVADIVTCSQSFHWMQAEPVLQEVARLLRRGGVFAIYDYVWPPLIDIAVEQALSSILQRSGLDLSRPEKAGHGERLLSSGHFGYVRRLHAHGIQNADAAQLLALVRSNGAVAGALASHTPEELGFVELHEALSRLPSEFQLFWPYHGWLAIKG